MCWLDVQRAWPTLGDRIRARWPAMRPDDLSAIAGDRSKFVAYLARTHDLTPSEAEESIELWLYRIRDAARAA